MVVRILFLLRKGIINIGLFRKNCDDRGAVSQQGISVAARSGVCPAGAAVHCDDLLLLHAQVARAAQAHVVIPYFNVEAMWTLVSK